MSTLIRFAGICEGFEGGSWCHCRLCSVVIQQEDEEGKVGVKIGRELMSTAAKALKSNITRLAPLVLPVSEQLIFASNFVARKVGAASHLCTPVQAARVEHREGFVWRALLLQQAS